MKTKVLALVVVCGTLASFFAVGIRMAGATQAGVAPSAEQVRFQLVGNEPIAGPDGRALVSGWSVLVVKDRQTERCHVVFTRGSAISATEPVECPATRGR